MKNFQFSEKALDNAINKMCDVLYDSDPHFECEIYFWHSGEITVSGLMSQNSDMWQNDSPVWTYSQTGSYAEDVIPKEETLKNWFDFIKYDIYENKPENIEII